ncbi:MAG: TolC family protein [Tidjanibacter sp.]|nr:TolC family protein [Tidjanibacter sp.]
MVRKIKQSIIALLALVGVQGSIYAQSFELTLSKSLEIALSDNPTIRVADMEIERQDWVRKQTVGNLLPNISVSSQYSYSIVKQEMAKGLSFGADNSISNSATLTLPLYAPTVYETLKMNRTQMEQAVESARSSKINLVNEVKKSYYNILLAEQSLVVLRESEKSISETVSNTETMYKQGLASEYDLLSAQVQLSNLRPTIVQTENSIKSAKLLFKMYLGLPEGADFTLAGSLDDFAEEVAMATIPTNEVDFSNNADLRALELQSKLLEHQLRLVNASRLPTVAAFTNFIYSGNDNTMDFSSMMGGGAAGGMGGGAGAGGSAPSTKKEWWWQNPLSAGISISIPLFSGGKNINKAHEIRNTLSQLSLQKDYLRQSIGVQIESAFNNILTAREKMTSNEITVRQAQKAYEIAGVRYNAGSGTILELNSSELSLTQAKLNYSQAIYDYLAARADYEKIIGEGFEVGATAEEQTPNTQNAEENK